MLSCRLITSNRGPEALLTLFDSIKEETSKALQGCIVNDDIFPWDGENLPVSTYQYPYLNFPLRGKKENPNLSGPYCQKVVCTT